MTYFCLVPTSNIIVISLLILMISPELRHNFLLSSKTVFMFSILVIYGNAVVRKKRITCELNNYRESIYDTIIY